MRQHSANIPVIGVHVKDILQSGVWVGQDERLQQATLEAVERPLFDWRPLPRYSLCGEPI